MSFSGYNNRFPRGEGEHAWISSDTDIVSKYDNDPFCSYIFCTGGFVALYETLIYLAKKQNVHNIRKDIPILVTAGSDDPVGSYGKGPTKCFELYKSLGIKDATLKLYEGQRHEIINEVERERVHADIGDSIFAHI